MKAKAIIQPIEIYKIIVSIGLLYIKMVFDITPINAHVHITDNISIPTFFGSENMHSGVYVAAIKIYMPIHMDNGRKR